MKTSSKTGKKVKKTIPWSLHMAIVRLQGTEELEYEEACAHAAMLIEEGGERFKEEVKAEASTSPQGEERPLRGPGSLQGLLSAVHLLQGEAGLPQPLDLDPHGVLFEWYHFRGGGRLRWVR